MGSSPKLFQNGRWRSAVLTAGDLLELGALGVALDSAEIDEAKALELLSALTTALKNDAEHRKRRQSVLEYACACALLSREVPFELQHRALELLGIDEPLNGKQIRNLPKRPAFWKETQAFELSEAEGADWYIKILQSDAICP